MTMRIAIGFVIQIIALLSAGIIELLRYKMVRDSGLVAAFIAAGPDADPLDPKFTEPMRCVGWAGRAGGGGAAAPGVTMPAVCSGTVGV